MEDSNHGHGRVEGVAETGLSSSSSSSSVDGIIAPFASLQLAPLSLSSPHPLLLDPQQQQESQASGSGSGGILDFDADDFLCSRATGTKLNDIVAELETYHEQVQSHLFSLLQSHASEFRDLAYAVQQDAATIDLFGVSSARNSIDPRRPSGGAATQSLSSSSAGQTADLSHVRNVVEQTRDRLAGVRAEVDAVMEERKLCSHIQAQLALLLSLHHSILCLESLLGLQGPGHIAAGGGGPGSSNSEDRALEIFDFRGIIGDLDCPNDMVELAQDGEDDDCGARVNEDLFGLFNRTTEEILGDAAALEEDEQIYDFLMASNSLLPPEPPTPGAPGLLSPTARRKSLAPAARRRSSAQSSQNVGALSRRVSSYYGGGGGAGAGASSPEHGLSILTLREPEIENVPERIAKALEEMQVLISLIRRALDQGLRSFVSARSKQLNGIGLAFQEDLKLVLSRLLGSESLILTPIQKLVAAAQEGALATSGQEDGVFQNLESLEAWSLFRSKAIQNMGDDDFPVVITSEEQQALLLKRRAEQESWLRLTFASYRALDTLLSISTTATAAAQVVEGSVSSAVLACRQDLEQTLRSGMLSQWVTKSIRTSHYTLHIKSSSEPGYSAPDTRTKPSWGLFPTPLDGTAQIPPLNVTSSELSSIGKSSPEYETDSQTSEALRRVYNEILRFLSEDLRDLINIGASDTDTFGVVWDEISRAVLEELGNVIFFVGRPNSFQQNFTLTARFLQLVAQLSPTKAALKRLHEHAGFIAFQKRWQLSVYFRIRLRHVLSTLETGLGQGLAPTEAATSNAADGTQCAQLQAIQATYEAFSTPWQKDVHLRPLLAREWTLSLQIVSRFKTWLEHEVLNESSVLNQQLGGEGVNGAHRRTPSASNSWLANHGHTPSGRESPRPQSHSRTSSPALGSGTNNKSVPGSQQQQQQEEAEKLRLLRWTWIASDVAWLDGRLWKVFEDVISPAVKHALTVDIDGHSSPGADEALAVMRDALQNALGYRRGFVAVLGRNIVSSLRQACATAFETLNRSGAITRQYRATTSSTANSGPVPSELFVGQIIAPLTEYFGLDPDSSTEIRDSSRIRRSATAQALNRLDVETRTGWAQDVVDDLIDRYANALFTMNKTLESLRRLKRGSTTLGFGSLFGVSASQQQQSHQQQQQQQQEEAKASGLDKPPATDPESQRTRKQMEADVAGLKVGLERLCGVGRGLVLEGGLGWERLRRAAAGESEGGVTRL